MDAFCSVQDMIHAAIASYGVQASLREVRITLCRRRRAAPLPSFASELRLALPLAASAWFLAKPG